VPIVADTYKATSVFYSIGFGRLTDYSFQLFGNISGHKTDNWYMNMTKTLDQAFTFKGKVSPVFIEFKFKLGNKLISQTRKVYSLLDFGADIGGLYGSIQPVCATLVALFSGALYYSSLITDLYPIHNDASIRKAKKKKSNHIGNEQDPTV